MGVHVHGLLAGFSDFLRVSNEIVQGFLSLVLLELRCLEAAASHFQAVAITSGSIQGPIELEKDFVTLYGACKLAYRSWVFINGTSFEPYTRKRQTQRASPVANQAPSLEPR